MKATATHFMDVYRIGDILYQSPLIEISKIGVLPQMQYEICKTIAIFYITPKPKQNDNPTKGN